MKGNNINFSFEGYCFLLTRPNYEGVLFDEMYYSKYEEIDLSKKTKTDIYKQKDIVFKNFKNFREKLEKFNIQVEDIVTTSNDIERKGITIYKKGELKLDGKKTLVIGHKIKNRDEISNHLLNLINIMYLESNMSELDFLKSSRTDNMDLIDFERKEEDASWIYEFDILFTVIKRRKLIELTYKERDGSVKDNVLIAPLKFRRNLYGTLYVICIELSSNLFNGEEKALDISSSIKLNKFTIISLQRIIGIKTCKGSYSFNRFDKQNLDAELSKIIGVIIPENQTAIEDIKLRVHNFQANYFKIFGEKYSIEKDPEDPNKSILTFNVIPTFEFMRQAIILQDVWNYSLKLSKENTHIKETAVELLNNDKMREYLKQTYRRALVKYEDDLKIKSALTQKIEEYKFEKDPFF